MVKYKPYDNLHSLFIPTKLWKSLFIDFITGLLILIDLKDDNYDSILIVIYCLTKIVYYKPVKITIDILSLAKVIINIIIYHYDIFKLIVID